MKGYLYRIKELSNDKQTIGKLIIVDPNNNYKKVFECYTLELPWKDNAKNVSCIPDLFYIVDKQHSNKFGEDTFTINNVPNRSEIRIHNGNFYYDIEGCILVGDRLSDINSDGLVDVLNSNDTLIELKGVVDKFSLQIYWIKHEDSIYEI